MSGASDAKKITKYVNEIMRFMDRVTELELAHENYKSMVRERDKRITELEAELAALRQPSGELLKIIGNSLWSMRNSPNTETVYHEERRIIEFAAARENAIKQRITELKAQLPKVVEPASGWCFHTADFSVQAHSGRPTDFGTVTLVRSPEERTKWHNLDDDLKDSVDCPELYVTGRGKTLDEAMKNANASAAKAKKLDWTDGSKGGEA